MQCALTAAEAKRPRASAFKTYEQEVNADEPKSSRVPHELKTMEIAKEEHLKIHEAEGMPYVLYVVVLRCGGMVEWGSGDSPDAPRSTRSVFQLCCPPPHSS